MDPGSTEEFTSSLSFYSTKISRVEPVMGRLRADLGSEIMLIFLVECFVGFPRLNSCPLLLREVLEPESRDEFVASSMALLFFAFPFFFFLPIMNFGLWIWLVILCGDWPQMAS